MGRKKQIYALYRGDEFINLGTIEELARYEKVKPRSIRYLQTPAYKKKFKEDNNRRVLIKIEGDY
jgi:hypothetical protein